MAGASGLMKYPGGLPPSSRDFRATCRTNCFLRRRGLSLLLEAEELPPKRAALEERRCEGSTLLRGRTALFADRLLSTRKLILRTASARTPWTARPAAPLVAAGLPLVRPDAPGARAPNLGAPGHAPLVGCSLP
jgi:hypothetical protein